MSQREWIEKDFYKELGVSSSATAEEIKKAYRKLARDNHPDANPGNASAENKFKAVSEAHAVLADPAKRKEYDEARRLFASGGFGSRGGGGFSPGAGGFGGGGQTFDVGDIFGQGGGDGGIGDLFGGLFNRGGAQQRTQSNRPRRGSDVETETSLQFREAAQGVTVPLKLTSPSSCTTCHGSGAKPGTSPRVCPRCNGQGVVNRNQGAFGFSEPCDDCRGSGSIIDDPCADCRGTGVQNRTRTITVRVPAGISDGQKVRLAGQGEAGLRGAPSGDLFVTVRVKPDKVFGRTGDDLTVTVPVSYGELVLGTTLSVPTLDGRVGVKVPPGTVDGRVLRVRGRGVPKKSGTGDLMVTVKVAVPQKLDDAATDALKTYLEAEKASGFDPRAGWAGV
ncbi:molecular chaperone DnaJ [Rhodococcus sp. 06-418-5]|uniref:molecular chaperone DnaJ n=1 Tax=unclassified Rhodococcus (in: high G+C Gram-positive bacteria) TaxID=192944 RepID=UPI0005D804E5|nr:MULTISPECIES: molecular chaperone DnaJ [unclassified Rhodococcus (in: high G+C Gram-positive bacteria)]AJW40867.1 Chaperone protein DnaJ [Rhodococcus sp. B7740]OZC85003.1 molecular chaperone DnaJ [Rhodococcus sp. 06-418-5]OZC85235.1 molecular chaperone DnaJ [Rhodococcus sp. 06-418-5]OZE06916.1 molecular chaperone DnaJ [Rhodococcus sp. 05-2255-3B1]OZE12744.1 molecular chaperone DnaJ [Rhodococcus sp. 05-2255-2A2]